MNNVITNQEMKDIDMLYEAIMPNEKNQDRLYNKLAAYLAASALGRVENIAQFIKPINGKAVIVSDDEYAENLV